MSDYIQSVHNAVEIVIVLVADELSEKADNILERIKKKRKTRFCWQRKRIETSSAQVKYH